MIYSEISGTVSEILVSHDQIVEKETASKFEYVKAIANKMMGNTSSSDIVIQKYQVVYMHQERLYCQCQYW